MTAIKTSTDSVLQAIREYSASDNPSSFLAMNEGNSYFAIPNSPGVIVYRKSGRYLVQFGGPFAPDECYGDLLRAFVEFAEGEDHKVVAVQLQNRDAHVYADCGFTVNQIGASYAVDLEQFSLVGTRFMRLRNKISRAFRNGLTVVEVNYDDWRESAREIDRLWLPLKGEGVRQLEYLVGQCGGEAQQFRRLFIGLIEDVVVGYILYSPVFGNRPGWMHDLSRRRPDTSPGIMEAINKTAIDLFHTESVRWLHFGFTPFTGLDEMLEVPGSSHGFRWFMNYLWHHGETVYPAATQLSYKEKWNQTIVLPEYIASWGPASIAAFVHIFRACNAL